MSCLELTSFVTQQNHHPEAFVSLIDSLRDEKTADLILKTHVNDGILGSKAPFVHHAISLSLTFKRMHLCKDGEPSLSYMVFNLLLAGRT